MKPTLLIVSQAVLAVGGIERYIEQLARGLRSSFRIVVAGPLTPPFEAAMAGTGAKLVSVPRRGKLSVTTMREVDALIRAEHPRVVLAVEPRARLVAHPVAWMRRVPALVTLEITTDAYQLPTAQARAYRLVEGTYDRWFTRHVVYVSDYDRRRGPTPPARASTIHNSVDVDAFGIDEDERKALRREARAQLGVPSDLPLLITVGRMAYQKAPEVLIDAIALAQQRSSSSFVAVWVGDGEERTAIEARIADRGVGPHVHLVGAQTAPGVRRWLLSSDVFVLASHFECFPLSILEACAAGLPCVVTDVGGNTEAIQDGVNGRVVPPRDPDALATALIEMVDHPERRAAFGQAARQSAEDFSTPHMVARTEALLRRFV